MPADGTTDGRGYGAPHQRTRAAVAIDVIRGRATCWRCNQPIHPAQPWDLGHDDTDPTKTRYRGPEHVHCNRSAGARKGNAKRAQLRRAEVTTQRVSRLEW